MIDVQATALRMAARGWHVFPVEAGGKRPALPRAHPAGVACRGECGTDGHGLHDATTRPERIRRWWTGRPHANVGISCGPSGLVVVDVDTGKGTRPDTVLADQGDAPTPGEVSDGLGVLTWLADRCGSMADLATATVLTPTGGRHLYYTAPVGLVVTSGAGLSGGLGWQVDVRAHGGYVVGAHSRRPEGVYRPVPGLPLRALPAWLLLRLQLAGRIPQLPRQRTSRPLARIDAGTARATGYLRAAVAGEVQRVLDAGEGARNHALNRAAFALGQLVATHGLDEQAAGQALAQAADTAGLPAGEAATTIRSGLSAGRRNARGDTP